MTIKNRVKKLEEVKGTKELPFLVVSEQEGVLYAMPSQLPVNYRATIAPADYMGQVITPEQFRELELTHRIIHIIYTDASVLPAREGEDVINMFEEDDRKGQSCDTDTGE